MTDKQFDDAFTAAGGWFILTQYDIIADWKGEKSDLVDELFKAGFDSKRSGTNTRVSSTLRLINNNRWIEVREKIINYRTINRIHPESKSLAIEIIKKGFNNVQHGVTNFNILRLKKSNRYCEKI